MITIKRKDGNIMMSLDSNIYSIATDNGFIVVIFKDNPLKAKYIIPMTEIKIVEFD